MCCAHWGLAAGTTAAPHLSARTGEERTSHQNVLELCIPPHDLSHAAPLSKAYVRGERMTWSTAMSVKVLCLMLIQGSSS